MLAKVCIKKINDNFLHFIIKKSIIVVFQDFRSQKSIKKKIVKNKLIFCLQES